MHRREIPLGPFQLDTPIGQGGMGQIWRGRHVATDAPVAVKVLRWKQARSDAYIEAFRREARAVAEMHHPAILPVFDYGLIDDSTDLASAGKLTSGSPYLVMPLAAGSLNDDQIVFCWADLRHLASTLLDSLAHAHARGVVHRDIKPANVLVLCHDTDGPPDLALTDFGLAHPMLEATGDEPLDAGCGTPGYMAPEQFVGEWRDFGPWTDLYALGIMLWRVACGRLPFQHRNVFALADMHLAKPLPPLEPWFAVPAGLDRWLRRLCAKQPGDRFQRAADARAELELLGPPAAAPVAPRAAPLPEHWRLPSDDCGCPLLVGAGLGLYGLRTVPLVGREQERDRLWRELHEAVDTGAPRVVCLRGPAGCGKSRLAEWLCIRAHELGAADVLRAQHSRLEGPGDGLGGMIGRHMRAGGLHEQALGEHVERVLRGFGVRDEREWRALALLIESTAGRGGRRGSTVRFRRPRERFVLIERYLRHVANRRPVILWLDDVQWGMEALAFSAHLLEKRLPVLVVMTVRDDALAERPRADELLQSVTGPAVERVDVGPLDEIQRRELVGQLLGLSGEVAAQVEERTAGNPLFAVQLVGDWVQRGLLVPRETGFRLSPGAVLDLPDDLHAVWSRRLDRALAGRPESDRTAIELAAVLGGDVDIGEWAGACRLADLTPPWRVVESLVREQLARPESAIGAGPSHRVTWAFAHNMLRESLMRHAGEAGRLRALHGFCADMLQDAGDPEVAERVGRHLVAADRLLDALGPLAEGARLRLEQGDNRMAGVLLEERAEVMARLALPAGHIQHGAGRWLGLRLLRMRGEFDRAEAEADALVADAATHGWLEARALGAQERGRLAWVRGQPDLAERHLIDAARGAEALGDASMAADCLRVRGLVALHRGDHETAVALFEEALEGYSEAGDSVWAAACVLNLGISARLSGRTEEARLRVHQALGQFRLAEARWGEAECLNELGEGARQSGDLEAAEDFYRQALDRNRSLGSGDTVFNETNLGLVLSGRERWAEARQTLEGALDVYAAQGRQAFVGVTHALLAVPSAATLDWPAFDRHVESATLILDGTGFVDPDAATELFRAGQSAAGANEVDRAFRVWRLAVRLWRALGRADKIDEVTSAMRATRSDGTGRS